MYKGIRFCLLALTCLSSVAFMTTANAQKVTIATGEWGPYVSENMDHYGIAPQIITAAFAKVGIEVEYQFYPWSRAMKEAEDARADLTGIWYFNEERGKKFTYSDNVLSAANIFFYNRQNTFDWNDYASFPDVKVGVTRGYSYSAKFDQAVSDGLVNTEITGNDELNFRKLLRQRTDVFVMAELAGYDMLKSKFSERDRNLISAHPTKVSSAPLHLLTAKGNKRGAQFLVEFNKGLKALKASGELQEILNAYTKGR